MSSGLMSVWLREASYELDRAHQILDLAAVPRMHADGHEYSLAARIFILTLVRGQDLTDALEAAAGATPELFSVTPEQYEAFWSAEPLGGEGEC